MIYKRGKVYWHKFMWAGKLVRESTKQGNDKVAQQMESAHRTSLAKGEVGIRDKKPVLMLAKFIDARFEPWAEATLRSRPPKTWLDWYRVGLAVGPFLARASKYGQRHRAEWLAKIAEPGVHRRVECY